MTPRFLPLLILILAHGAAPFSYAKTIHVDSSSGSASSPYASWTDAATTLQDALAVAVAGDEIWVAEGTYYPDEGGSAVAGARDSTFTLIEDVEIFGGYPAGGGTRDPDTNPTILSGDLDQDGTSANNAYHVLWGGSSISAAVVLDGFTITAGNANGGSAIQKRGGGIYCDSASPQFVSCAFEGNQADIRSGACHLVGSSAPSFLDCRFISNVSAHQGGAIFCEQSSQTSFEKCQFISNSAVVSGGALRIDSSQVVQVDKCVFLGNSVTNGSGGAIYTARSSPTFTQCAFSGNSATGSGGGIHFGDPSTPVLTSCTILGNSAAQSGGGIYNDATSAILTNCLIWNNRDGSGIGTTEASFSNPLNGILTLNFCLVQSWNPSGTGNLDGTDPANDPRFVLPVDPSTAPATYGDLRLRMGSPAINVGDDTATSELTDLLGRARKNGTIDLGAYEHHAYVVDITADEVSDPGTGTSLREAIALANAEPLPSQIEFDPTVFGTSQTITLDHVTHGLLTLSASCAMVGPGSSLLTVDTNGGIRPLTVDDGDSDTFQNVVVTALRLTGGNANGVAFTDDTRGGGLFCQEHLQLHDVMIENNSADGFGGGLALTSGADAWIQRCQILGNVAGGSGGGGGMRLNADSSVHIVDTIFRGNHATGAQIVSGGGAILTKAGLELTLINCLFQGNRSNSRGGALRLENDAQLVNCSLQGNATAVDGGAIYVSSAAPSLRNSIVWYNSQNGLSNTPSASIFNSTSTTSVDYCLIANSGGSAAWDSAIGTDGGNNLDTDPFFIQEGNPNDAAFISGDLRLRCDSPAIDVGKNNANAYTYDLAGNPRIVDGNADTTSKIDLGAYEVPLSSLVTSDADAGSGSLREAITTTAVGGSLTFDATLDGGTITLSSGQLVINKALTIDASALASGLTIDGDSSFRHFNITDGNNAVSLAISITGLQLINGSASSAGSINNFENLTLDDCHFADNTATGVSGVAGALRIRSDGDATLTNCSFQGNSGGFGGAIYNESNATPTLTNCDFQGNSTSRGGGIYNAFSSPTLTNCGFQGNRANDGGGIYNESSSPALTNCCFQGNSSDNVGGGIFNFSSSPTLTNCCFQGNRANNIGGGILNSRSSPIFTNCIIWNNQDSTGTGTADSSVYTFTGTPSYDHCLIEGRNPTGTGNLDGTDPLNDPLFVLPVDPNAAPTTAGDLRLLSTSPALNAGDGVMGASANTTTIDLASNPRFSITIDLGAYELPPDQDGDGLTDAYEEANTNPSNPTSLAPTDDQDGDGLTALEEFAYGLSDLVPNQTGYPEGGVYDDSGTLYQSIHYHRNWNAIPFLNIVCERSTDLGVIDDWSTGETMIVSETMNAQSANVDDVVERSLTDIASQLREFLQVRVSKR